MESAIATAPKLPGLDCGLCGYPTCDEFEARLVDAPELLKRCIHLDTAASVMPRAAASVAPRPSPLAQASCQACVAVQAPHAKGVGDESRYVDSLGRDFDFVLQRFPEDPGPREIILPHNPMLTREMEIKVGDVMIGRPLGMSCGCPVTHCGEVMDVDRRTGVITWCVTGPLRPRQEGFKDIGYYIAEAYEGLVQASRCELKIGIRYFFMPDLCMLQWRHSGLVNYLNRNPDAQQVRLEGLWIG
jgi:uncharacterized Fe-S cluster-containing protein